MNNFILHKIADGGVVDRLKKSISGIDKGQWNMLPGLAPGQALVLLTSMTRPLLVSIDPTRAGSNWWRRMPDFYVYTTAAPRLSTQRPHSRRALNQVTYCPRLYYLEYVEGIMPVNEHVADGLFKHRRVDDAKTAVGHARKAMPCTPVASLWLRNTGSDRQARPGRGKRGGVYPVEYKRCSANRADGQATYWDNDAVQLCAQGLLLEEDLGDRCRRRALLHRLEKRVEVSLDETLRAQTLDAITRIRAIATATPPPPLPAELPHRCLGCSLLTVCQPEETRFSTMLGQQQPSKRRGRHISRVIPELDEGAVLYLQEPGSYVGKRSEHLVVSKDRQEINRVPLAAVRQVVVFGNVQVSTQALETLASMRSRWCCSPLWPLHRGADAGADEKRHAAGGAVPPLPIRARLALAKAVVQAKIANQRTLLMRSLRAKSQDDEASSGAAMSRPPRDGPHAGAPGRGTRYRRPAGAGGTGGERLLRRVRPVAAQPGAGECFRLQGPQPPAAARPGQRAAVVRLRPAAKDCFSAVCTVGFDPYHGFFHGGSTASRRWPWTSWKNSARSSPTPWC